MGDWAARPGWEYFSRKTSLAAVHATDPGDSTGGGDRARMSPRLVRIGGFVIAGVALSLCALALVDQWQSVSAAIEHADYRLIAPAFVTAALGMSGLGVLWWRCLHMFGERVAFGDAVGWYFAGELGKYIPGGIWPVLGRGELAKRRGGIGRPTSYATTLISYSAMCASAAVCCGALAVGLLSDRSIPNWGWAIVGLIPIVLLVSHPVVFGRVLEAVHLATKGRVRLGVPPWPQMLGLILVGIPTWLLVGASSALMARALGFDGSPSRIAFAAVAAWIVGFLAVPVPAGVGLRELIFVALCGLGAGRGAAVAAGARLLLVCVDGIGGLVGLGLAALRSAASGDRLVDTKVISPSGEVGAEK
jgi:glycosyltransferase 2 family protein